MILTADRARGAIVCACLALLGGCTAANRNASAEAGQPAYVAAASSPHPAEPPAAPPPAVAPPPPAAPSGHAAGGELAMRVRRVQAMNAQMQAQWLQAIKTTPALQAQIKNGASYPAVMAMANAMATRGAARLGADDLRKRGEALEQIGRISKGCTNGFFDSTGADYAKTLERVLQPIAPADMNALVMAMDTFQTLQTRALRAEANQTPIRPFSEAEYKEAMRMVYQAMPFDDGALLASLLQKGSAATTKAETCQAGMLLMRGALRLPPSYGDTAILGLAMGAGALHGDKGAAAPKGPQIGI